MPCSKKSRKNSSNGEPGGNCGISGPACSCSRPRSDFRFCWVEMFTTDGSSLSARSAKLSGAGRAATGRGKTTAGNTIRTAVSALAAARQKRDDTRVKLLALRPDRSLQPPPFPPPHALEGQVGDDRFRSPFQSGEITGEGRCRQSLQSTAHQPDKNDTGAGGGEPRQPQGLRGNRRGARRGPLHSVGKQRVESALDHQHERQPRRQILHLAGRWVLAIVANRSAVLEPSPCRPRRSRSQKSGRNRNRGSAQRMCYGR